MVNGILKKIFKNASVVFGGSTIAGAMGLVCISLVARTLGAEKLGVFAMIQSFAVIIDRLMNFQCWQVVIKFGADFLKQDKKEEFKSLAKFCIILDAATAALGAIVSVLVIYFFGKWKNLAPQTVYAGLIFGFWILFNLKGTSIGLLRLNNKFKLIAGANVAGMSLKLILIIFAYFFSGGLAVFAAIWAVSIAVESAILLWAGYKAVHEKTGGNFLRAKLSITAKDKTVWKFVMYTNLNQSVRLAARELDVLIVGSVLGAAATGIYKIARQFAMVLTQLIEPAYQAIYPELAHLAAEKKFPELKQVAAKASVTVGGISLLGWLGFVLLGKWILRVAAGAEYVQAYGVMIVFMFAFVIWGFMFSLPAGLLAMGKASKNMLVQIISLVVFLPVLYLLLNGLELIGAAVAQVTYFIIYAVFLLFFFAGSISKESH